MDEILKKCQILKKASNSLSLASAAEKNRALKYVAESIALNKASILKENQTDIQAAKKSGMKESLIDRLALNEKRIDEIVSSIETVIALDDPVGVSHKGWTNIDGLSITKITVPLGVIGIIYESRPNVTADAFAIAFKSGNCILLRGSSSAIHSNIEIVRAIKEGLAKSSISKDVIQIIEDTNRETVTEMLKQKEYIDVIIPRGSDKLIQFVINNSVLPVIETGVGNCHIYIDKYADIDKGVEILVNAKIQRPGVCNACEKVLVHSDVAEVFLKKMYDTLADKVELRGCERTKKIIDVKLADEKDWYTEYLDYILGIKIVDSIDQAIEHINKYGTMHSESIITDNYYNGEKFLSEVDAAAVYINASTRFTDGGVFGFGCEIGISTQKLHARGPMGLEELVSVKYQIRGRGQVRN